MQDSFYETKTSRFSLIDHYWRMRETQAGAYPLYATVKWGFVFSESNGGYSAKLIGPRTTPTEASYAKDEYFLGIVINADVNIAGYNKKDLLNQVISLAVMDDRFLLGDEYILIPDYNTVEEFTETLIKRRLLRASPIAAVSHRDKQRKIKRFTGLTPKQIQQAERVEYAISIINSPITLTSVAAQAGFSDQAHMTRDFNRLVGYSPAEIRRYFSDLHS